MYSPEGVNSTELYTWGTTGDIYDPGTLREWTAYDFDDGSDWNGHGDSLAAAGIDG